VADPIATARAIRRLTQNADVVVAHLPTTAVGILAARPRVPLVLVYHASLWRELRFDRDRGALGAGRALEAAFRVLERIAVQRAHRILVLSEFSRAQLIGDHPRVAHRVRLVSGGADTERFDASAGRAAARAAVGIDPRATLLVAARRLEPRMGLERLLVAVRLLATRRDVELAVVGAGSLDRELRELAVRLEVHDRVRFAGAVTDDELGAWYRAADLVVMPSLAYEGFGLVTAEALASGTPVVGTPVGATPELLRDLEPRLLAAGTSSRDIAATIETALSLDGPALRRRCRAYARDRLSWETALDGWEGALAEAARSHAPHGAPEIGLIAALPPQVGGVPSVAGWLIDNGERVGRRYVPFDLWRPPGGDSGGRLTIDAARLQARNAVRFVRWLPRSPRHIHYCVSANPTGIARDLVFLALLRMARRKTVVHVHSGSELQRAETSRLLRGAVRLLSRVSETVVAVSPSLADTLGRIGVPATTIMNPVRLEAPERPVPAAPRELRVLFVGAYGEGKGVLDLLQALAAVRARAVDATLLIAGKPRYAGDDVLVRQSVVELGLGAAVDFAGVLPPERLRGEYLSADVLCLPSLSEGLPMAVLEAMACGLPVLATRVGGVPDVVVDGETGVLVEPGDVRGIERGLAELAADPIRRARMGEEARRRVLQTSGEATVAAGWRTVYDRLEASV
jgi:glycosyltransferase involved in cell wall biosynthesis